MGTRGVGDEPSNVQRALVLFEDMRKKFDLVLEGYTDVQERVSQVSATAEERHRFLKKYLYDGLEKAYGDLGGFESRLKTIENRT